MTDERPHFRNFALLWIITSLIVTPIMIFLKPTWATLAVFGAVLVLAMIGFATVVRIAVRALGRLRR